MRADVDSISKYLLYIKKKNKKNSWFLRAKIVYKCNTNRIIRIFQPKQNGKC